MQFNTLPYSAVIQSPIGKIGIKVSDKKLINLDFLPATKIKPFIVDAFAKIVIAQLEQYFVNPNYQFDIPLELSVTPFQHQVLRALQKIPLGTTQSYGLLAQKLNTSPRAIGNACRRNPIAIIIPCHRIVAQNSIGGFAGKTSGKLIDIKNWLIQHEAL